MTAKIIPAAGEVFSGYIPAHRKLIHVSIGTATANPDITLSATGVYQVVDVTMPIVVFKVWFQTEEAWTTNATLTLGDTGSAARYSADTTTNVAATGAILIDGGLNTVPYVDSVGVDIEATLGGTALLAGLTHIYIEYAELND